MGATHAIKKEESLCTSAKGIKFQRLYNQEEQAWAQKSKMMT